MLYCFDDFENCTEESMKAVVGMVSFERIKRGEKYLKEKDRRLCYLSYLLLVYGAYREKGIFLERDMVFQKNEYGKPYLKLEQNFFFNISHCKSGAVCAVSDHEAGVDIQDIVEKGRDIARMVCGEEEMKLLRETSRHPEVFTRFWALKESYVKFLGTGLSKNVAEVNFAPFQENIFEAYGCRFHVIRKKNYYICLCTGQEDEDFKIEEADRNEGCCKDQEFPFVHMVTMQELVEFCEGVRERRG